MNKNGLIYLIGLIPLGLFYNSLKAAIGDPEFFIAGLIYLIGLRVVADHFNK